jgi:hypothetical protein
MKTLLLFFLFLAILPLTACRPSPGPQATTAKLTLTLTPVRRTEFGSGTVTFTPTPKSGDANCKLVGDKPITCSANFSLGESVTLSVFADPQASSLESINGCTVTKCEGCRPGETTCQLTMDGDKSVAASFIGLLH